MTILYASRHNTQRKSSVKPAAITRVSPTAIKKAREAAGHSQLSLAAAAGINQGNLSRIEAGLRQPHSSILIRIAAALGVSADSLFETRERKHATKRTGVSRKSPRRSRR